MSMIDDKRSEFIRRAALHSSKPSIGIPTDLKDGSAKRTLLRKRVSYPPSTTKATLASREMASTLPARKPLMRRSVGALHSSAVAVDLFKIRAKALQSATRLSTPDKLRSETSRSENVEPKNSHHDDKLSDVTERKQNLMGPDHLATTFMKKARDRISATTSDPLVNPSPLQESARSNPNRTIHTPPEASISQDNDALRTASAISTSQLSTETQASSSEPSLSDIPSVSDVLPITDELKPVEIIDVAGLDNSRQGNSDPSPPEAAAASLPAISSQIDTEKEPSSGESASPLSASSMSNCGSAELDRIVEMFRQSSHPPQKGSRPASMPQSPSTISSNRSVYSPVDEQRIQNRLADDEWKRRARTAEDALAKMRRELVQAESTYEEVLKKCSFETKEAVTRLNRLLEEEQEKVVTAHVLARMAEEDLRRTKRDVIRARTISKAAVLSLFLVIAIIVYDSLWRPLSYCS